MTAILLWMSAIITFKPLGRTAQVSTGDRQCPCGTETGNSKGAILRHLSQKGAISYCDSKLGRWDNLSEGVSWWKFLYVEIDYTSPPPYTLCNTTDFPQQAIALQGRPNRLGIVIFDLSKKSLRQIGKQRTISFTKWMERDLQYIDKWTFWLDLKILFKTIPAVMKGSGAV